jgi:hypothetical protein
MLLEWLASICELLVNSCEILTRFCEVSSTASACFEISEMR